jgi:hypothetical protein
MKTTSFFILTGAFSPAVYAFFGHLDPGTLAVAATSLLGFVGLLLQLREARKVAEGAAALAAAQRIADREAADAQRTADKELAEQHRKWDLEDRAATASKLATKVGLDADEVKRLIAENTGISRDAFHEANNVNGKIQKLGEELVSLKNNRKAAMLKHYRDGRKVAALTAKLDKPKRKRNAGAKAR